MFLMFLITLLTFLTYIKRANNYHYHYTLLSIIIISRTVWKW